MSDSLRERFAAAARPEGRANWADVRRRARHRTIRVPIAVAAAVGALAVAAPAVALVALLEPEADPPIVGTVWITIVPWGSTNLAATIGGEVYDRRVRTVVLAMKGRPQRRQRLAPYRTFLFQLSKRDLGRCGRIYALDAERVRIGIIPVPHIPRVPKKLPPPSGEIVVRPAPPPTRSC